MECKFWLLAITINFLFAATRTDHLDEMLAAENKCMEKYSTITPGVLNEMKETKDFSRFQAAHEDIDCFMYCFGLEMKLIDEDGVLHVENLRNITVLITKEAMSHDDAHAAVTECSGVAVHDDNCKKSGLYTACKFEVLKEFALHLTKHET